MVRATAEEFSTDLFWPLVYIGRDMHKILGSVAWADTLWCLNTFAVDESHVQTGRQVSSDSRCVRVATVRKVLGKMTTGNQEDGLLRRHRTITGES